MIQKHIRYAIALKKAKQKPKLLKPNWLEAQKKANRILLSKIDPALAQFKQSMSRGGW